MTSLFMALVGFFLFMIIMVCTSPRFTQNVRCFGDYTATFIIESIFSHTVLTIAQPHPPYCISYYFKNHASNCGWLWCWLYCCCPAPVTVACPCSLHCNDSPWCTITHNMSYSCVECRYVFKHTVWNYNYRQTLSLSIMSRNRSRSSCLLSQMYEQERNCCECLLDSSLFSVTPLALSL